MSKKKCLIVDPMHESLFSMMENIGWKTDYRPAISREEIKEIIHADNG
jgi:D-3-phosphoglycerate dehydrogenase